MTKKPKFTTTITVTKSTGVMAKDGKTPFAAGTMFQSETDVEGRQWKSPMTYSVDNIFASLAQPETDAVHVITPDNVEYVIKVLK